MSFQKAATFLFSNRTQKRMFCHGKQTNRGFTLFRDYAALAGGNHITKFSSTIFNMLPELMQCLRIHSARWIRQRLLGSKCMDSVPQNHSPTNARKRLLPKCVQLISFPVWEVASVSHFFWLNHVLPTSFDDAGRAGCCTSCGRRQRDNIAPDAAGPLDL